MKATGIVRRIDDLGRVVIPKEIRRKMRIREGDPLEIYTEGKTVCFRKYGDTLAEEIEALCDVVHENDYNAKVEALLRQAVALMREDEE